MNLKYFSGIVELRVSRSLSYLPFCFLPLFENKMSLCHVLKFFPSALLKNFLLKIMNFRKNILIQTDTELYSVKPKDLACL
jgi:hypothetical protein